jgi:23S rRNA (uracil1939-C5)-methyltransferase
MQTLRATIDSLAFGGNGVCRVNGKVCFVPFSAPGDVVSLAVTAEKRSYMTARIVDLLEASPQRISPPCPHFGICGGCSWQQIGYEGQLQAKRQILAESLWRGARVEAERIMSTMPSSRQFGYRSRVQFKLHVSHKGLQIGFFRNSTHQVEDLSQGCLIAQPVINQVLERFRAVLPTYADLRSIPEIHVDCGENGVAAVVSYTGKKPEQLVEFLVTRSSELSPLTSLFIQTAAKVMPRHVCGDHELTFGLQIHDPVSPSCQLSYRVGGFSQVNRAQNQAMLEVVHRMAGCDTSEDLLDLYCGNGNFSLPLARYVARVTGIEGHAGSIDSARNNSLRNSITNATFICEDAARGARRLADEGCDFHTVLLDPPRSGAAEVLPEICRLKPVTIIYVSCDPSTLARDCGLLAENGYLVKESVPVDMFPQTYHIESVTLLQKY